MHTIQDLCSVRLQLTASQAVRRVEIGKASLGLDVLWLHHILEARCPWVGCCIHACRQTKVFSLSMSCMCNLQSLVNISSSRREEYLSFEKGLGPPEDFLGSRPLYIHIESMHAASSSCSTHSLHTSDSTLQHFRIRASYHTLCQSQELVRPESIWTLWSPHGSCCKHSTLQCNSK